MLRCPVSSEVRSWEDHSSANVGGRSGSVLCERRSSVLCEEFSRSPCNHLAESRRTKGRERRASSPNPRSSLFVGGESKLPCNLFGLGGWFFALRRSWRTEGDVGRSSLFVVWHLGSWRTEPDSGRMSVRGDSVFALRTAILGRQILRFSIYPLWGFTVSSSLFVLRGKRNVKRSTNEDICQWELKPE